jgi:hypothetical protein
MYFPATILFPEASDARLYFLDFRTFLVRQTNNRNST